MPPPLPSLNRETKYAYRFFLYGQMGISSRFPQHSNQMSDCVVGNSIKQPNDNQRKLVGNRRKNGNNDTNNRLILNARDAYKTQKCMHNNKRTHNIIYNINNRPSMWPSNVAEQRPNRLPRSSSCFFARTFDINLVLFSFIPRKIHRNHYYLQSTLDR